MHLPSDSTVTIVDARDPQQFKDAIRPNTKMFFFETPANPTNGLVDIAAARRISESMAERAGGMFDRPHVAEMLGVKSGLGFYMQWAQGWAAYPNMYAALLVMSLMCTSLITLSTTNGMSSLRISSTVSGPSLTTST